MALARVQSEGTYFVVTGINDLCTLDDPDLFQKAAEGIAYIVKNFYRLDTAAHTLSKAGDHLTAKILGNCAKEEAAKVLILVDAVRSPPKSPEKERLIGYFGDHFAKCVYADACNWSPVDFKDLEAIFISVRDSHYLDGPTGTDWIFENDYIQCREGILYVDYIRDDSDQAGQGPCYWQHPRADLTFPYLTSSVIRVALALHQVGLTSPAGLKVVAETWRPQQIQEMRCAELRQLNRRTLEALENKDLLGANEEGGAYKIILGTWPFPLWPLHLKISNVDKDNLRRVRRSWSPND